MPTLLVTLGADALSDRQLDAIRDAAPDHEVVRQPDAETLGEAEVVLGSFPRAALADAPRLRWVQSWSAGVDWLLEPDDADAPELPTGLMLTTASGVHPVPIAEHVLAVVLAFARDLPAWLDAQGERRWARGTPPDRGRTFELAGRRLTLLGVGEVGSRIARVMHALGVHVTAVEHTPGDADLPGVDHTITNDELIDALPETDLLVVTLPLTDATRGLVGAGAIAALPDHAIVVNVGRGGVVDEAALASALAGGRLGGAALDVFETEPLPEDSPLWGLDRVILTPHTAGFTPHYADRALALFLDNLSRYQRGEPLDNTVDLGEGY